MELDDAPPCSRCDKPRDTGFAFTSNTAVGICARANRLSPPGIPGLVAEVRGSEPCGRAGSHCGLRFSSGGSSSNDVLTESAKTQAASASHLAATRLGRAPRVAPRQSDQAVTAEGENSAAQGERGKLRQQQQAGTAASPPTLAGTRGGEHLAVRPSAITNDTQQQ
ncbi:unnamed protein product [Lampetra planeri]